MEITMSRTTSTTDPDCGYMNHGTKHGVGYLTETTVDSKHGIITGMDVYPANEKEKQLWKHWCKKLGRVRGENTKKALQANDTETIHAEHAQF